LGGTGVRTQALPLKIGILLLEPHLQSLFLIFELRYHFCPGQRGPQNSLFYTSHCTGMTGISHYARFFPH
jgi:hypothetical protein